jgi:23S rRNA A2030 N6-methylase RlmJ
MCADLQNLAQQNTLDFTRDEWMFEGAEKGMLGSGMFILNTPYRCAGTMEVIRGSVLTHS